jgi:hypothetical protein
LFHVPAAHPNESRTGQVVPQSTNQVRGVFVSTGLSSGKKYQWLSIQF